MLPNEPEALWGDLRALVTRELEERVISSAFEAERIIAVFLLAGRSDWPSPDSELGPGRVEAISQLRPLLSDLGMALALLVLWTPDMTLAEPQIAPIYLQLTANNLIPVPPWL